MYLPQLKAYFWFKNKSHQLIVLYLTIFIIVSVSKIYIRVHPKEMKRLTQQLSNISRDNYSLKTKAELKNEFHLNIFDFEEFNLLQHNDLQEPGTCVRTSLEVTRFI